MTQPLFFESADAQQNRFLTEGCCPNRHGPMLRIDEKLVVCPQCKGRWSSDRIPIIWPRRLREMA